MAKNCIFCFIIVQERPLKLLSTTFEVPKDLLGKANDRGWCGLPGKSVNSSLVEAMLPPCSLNHAHPREAAPTCSEPRPSSLHKVGRAKTRPPDPLLRPITLSKGFGYVRLGKGRHLSQSTL